MFRQLFQSFTRLCLLLGANDAESYRTLTAALERGDFAHARSLARGFAADSSFALKASFLDQLAAFLARDGRQPPAAANAAQLDVGALHAALTRDGAFAAAVTSEGGVGGYRPVLFGWPQAWSSRISLVIDGEPLMLNARGDAIVQGRSLVLATRERDVDVRLELSLDARPASDPGADASAQVDLAVTVTNRGVGTHAIGVRALLDLAQSFDDAPMVRLGQNTVLDAVTEFAGDDVPRTLGVGDRELWLRGLGEAPIDRVVLAPLADALAAPFDFQVASGVPLGPDSCLALYRDSRPLAPGRSCRLHVHMGPPVQVADSRPPLRTTAWTEPTADRDDVTRVLLMLENDTPPVTGSIVGLRVAVTASAGLELIARPDDLDRLGSLARGAVTQRSLTVRSTFAQPGPQEVVLDVASGGGVTKRLRVSIPQPPSLTIAGVVRDVRGTPVPEAQVDLLRAGRVVAHAQSAGDGSYRFDGVVPATHEVSARRVIHREPAAKANRADVDNVLYDVVLSSETILNDGTRHLPSVLPGDGRDVVMGNALTRYSLVVSVEWDAPRAYLEQVVRGVRRAAEFLLIASDGQLTFGRALVGDAAQFWNSADLYDWANNSVHPNADVAGIRHRYDPVTAPWNTAINFGRQWAPTWDSPGLYGTMVHEFGHYGLGLFDEYLGSPQGAYRGLAYWEMCRCIMGYQYSDHKICWQGNHHAYTNQGMWNGRSCWEQIEAWHEGMRGAFYAPITTPVERGGVVPPEFPSTIGNDLVAVIRDHDTQAFDARLQLAGPFGSQLAGALIYVDVKNEARSMYQGVTYGDGSMQLMGVHVGDHVRGFKDGARAEVTIDARRPAYTLEFGSEPHARQVPPLVMLRPERANGRAIGAAVEIVPLEPLALPPVLASARGRDRTLTLKAVPVDQQTRFIGTLPLDWFAAGRGSFECVLPDPDRGDLTLVTDGVMTELPAHTEYEVAAFDGSLRLRVPEGAIDAVLPLAIASTAGPSVIADHMASVGRLHAISVPRDQNPFLRPVLIVLAADHGEIRRFDAASRAFVPLPMMRSARPGELLAELLEPGVVALFE